VIAYNRVVEFLRELNAECMSELAGPASRVSEWRLGSQVFALRAEAGGHLRLFRLHTQSVGGRPDPIMDAVAELVFRGAEANEKPG